MYWLIKRPELVHWFVAACREPHMSPSQRLCPPHFLLLPTQIKSIEIDFEIMCVKGNGGKKASGQAVFLFSFLQCAPYTHEAWIWIDLEMTLKLCQAPLFHVTAVEGRRSKWMPGSQTEDNRKEFYSSEWRNQKHNTASYSHLKRTD